MNQNIQPVPIRFNKAANTNNDTRQTGNSSPLRRVDSKTSEALRARRVKVEPGHNHGAGFKGLNRSRGGGDSFQSFIIPSRNPNMEDVYAPRANYSFATLRNNLNTSKTSTQGTSQKGIQMLTKSSNILPRDPSPKKVGASELGKSFVMVENRLNQMQSPTQLNRNYLQHHHLTERVYNNEDSIQNILKQLKSSRADKPVRPASPTKFSGEAQFPSSKRKSPTFRIEEPVEKSKVHAVSNDMRMKTTQEVDQLNQKEKTLESFKIDKRKDMNK